MKNALGWSRTATNAALSIGLLISGLAAYPIGTWIDRGHGRRVMVCGSNLAAAMLALWSQAHSLTTLFVVWAGLGVALGVAIAATLYDPVFAVVTRDFPALNLIFASPRFQWRILDCIKRFPVLAGIYSSPLRLGSRPP
jgi:MFS family permease